MFIHFSKIKFNSEFLIFSQKTLLRSFQTLWNCESVYSNFLKKNKNENNFKLFEIIGYLILMYLLIFWYHGHSVRLGSSAKPNNILKYFTI